MNELAKRILERELPLATRALIYPIFQNANDAYNRLIEDGFFQSEISTNIKSRLLRYAIDRQFAPDMLNSYFPLKCVFEKVNNFGYKALKLIGKNIVINIAKTKDTYSLPQPSHYRLKYAQGNKEFCRQLMLDLEDLNHINIKPEPYYALITYGGLNQSIDFINLVMPDENLKSILARINLNEEISLYVDKDIQNPKEKEKKILTLKKEIIDLYIKNKGEFNE